MSRGAVDILEDMGAFLSKLAMIGLVAGGFFLTGDLTRLIERGRSITDRSTIPSSAPPTASESIGWPQSPAFSNARPPLPPATSQPAFTSQQATTSSPPRFDAPFPGHDAPAAPAGPAVEPPAAPVHRAASQPQTSPAAADPGPAEEPARIPMPKLPLESVDLSALAPGQRVLLLVGRLVIALDVVDGPAGEVLEHTHAWHADRTVTVASTAAPRRLVVVGGSAGSARTMPRPDRRVVRGEWVHTVPSGGATGTVERIGPVEAIGIE